MPAHRTDPMQRFLSRTRVAVSGCIEWTGSLTSSGYGRFSTWDGERQIAIAAHRWLYEQMSGALGDRILRHKCDNPRCVNLDHLEPGTQLDNVHDALERARRPQVLNEDLVRHFRTIRREGGSVRAEAKRLGIAYPTAINAAAGHNWRHVK